jgi:transcriptional regulator with XRE-family HTH domain
MQEAKPRLALRLAMVMSGKRQYEIAKLTGLSESAISKILANRRQVTPQEMAKLAEVLGTQQEELFPGECNMQEVAP